MTAPRDTPPGRFSRAVPIFPLLLTPPRNRDREHIKTKPAGSAPLRSGHRGTPTAARRLQEERGRPQGAARPGPQRGPAEPPPAAPARDPQRPARVAPVPAGSPSAPAIAIAAIAMIAMVTPPPLTRGSALRALTLATGPAPARDPPHRKRKRSPPEAGPPGWEPRSRAAGGRRRRQGDGGREAVRGREPLLALSEGKSGFFVIFIGVLAFRFLFP